jgi:hypothetical protein
MHPVLDGAVILLEHVIQIRHWPMLAILGQTAFGFELRNGGRIHGVAIGVDHSWHRMVRTAKRFEPVLPTESEEEWQKRLDGVKGSLNPGSYLEEQLAGQVALTLQQWDRLHRHEKIKTVHEMREFLANPFGEHGEHRETALALLEIGIKTTREQLARAERLKMLLEFLPMADPHKTMNDADGRLILESAISLCAKRTNGTTPFDEPQTWPGHGD